MTMLIIIAIAIPIIIASIWGIYYYIKLVGRKEERLDNIEKKVEDVEKSRKKTLKYRLDSVDDADEWLRKHTTD